MPHPAIHSTRADSVASAVDASHYSVTVAWSEEDAQFVATCIEFPSLSGVADTAADAIAELREALGMAIDALLDDREDVPVPHPHVEHSGKFLVRMPKGLHAALVARAAEEDVSLNTLVVAYLSGGIAGVGHR